MVCKKGCIAWTYRCVFLFSAFAFHLHNGLSTYEAQDCILWDGMSNKALPAFVSYNS